VPRTKPASVFPTPEANWPKAPALQVCCMVGVWRREREKKKKRSESFLPFRFLEREQGKKEKGKKEQNSSQLTESVPSSTSPGRQWPSCASATWQTPGYGV